MDASRWQLIRTSFDELIELDPSNWEPALLSRHPEDDGLREEVLEMLRADVEARGAPSRLADRSPQLLGQMADAEDAQQVRGWIGRQLGAWRIVRPLGRGGMGMVYLADREDGEFRQQAAIKLLRVNDDDGGMQRFLAERQILASLDHPNIAHLLDGGREPDGVPWFALEYVDGMALTAWCDSRRLGIRDRLLLFLDICSAVSYAHEHLIVHRDLKPANILIDSAGQVKLLDFGIAKLQDADIDQTRTALRMFTPEYAAPEQVRGERATTATDVYALGVILFELLTGRRPYRLAERTPQAIERAILNSDPPRPSGVATLRGSDPGNGPDTGTLAAHRGLNPMQLRACLRGDLDAIILKALRKEAASRYPSARDLAEDLRHALSLRPVLARKGGLRYRTGRFLRRNAIVMTLSAVAFVGLAAGLVVALAQTREAQTQRSAAEREAATAREALEFMEGLFQLSDPGATDGATVTARDVLLRGRERIKTEMSEQPAVRVALLTAMGSAFSDLGLDGEALPILEESAAIARELGDPYLIRASESKLASLLHGQGRYEEVVQRLLPLREAFEPNTDRERIQAAGIDYQLGTALYNLDRFNEAEPRIVSALALRRAVPELAPHSQGIVSVYVAVLLSRGRFEEATHQARMELEQVDRAGSPAERISALQTLGYAQYGAGNFSSAEQYFRIALERETTIYGTENDSVLRGTTTLAASLREQHRYREALELVEDVVAIRRRLGRPESRYVLARNLYSLGILKLRLGDSDGASAAANESLELIEAALAPGHVNSADTLQLQAEIALTTRRFDTAEALLDRAIAMREAKAGPDDPSLAPAIALQVLLDIRRGSGDGCKRAQHLSRISRGDMALLESEQAYRAALEQACLAVAGDAAARGKLETLRQRYQSLSLPGDPRVALLGGLLQKPATAVAD